MTETVTQAVARRDESPGVLIATYSKDFARVLPSHVKPETFVRLAQGVLRRDEKLARAAKANPASLMAALLDCARLGHDPGTEAYYLVPFGNEVQGIEGYRGEIERIYRAGAVASVKAEVVRANDHYVFDRRVMKVPDHRFDDFASDEERGPLRGAYAFAEMKDGTTSRVIALGRGEIMKHKAMSRNSDGASSPWQRWETSMWLKCCVHELEKWVPSSNEYRREILRATAEAQRVAEPASVPFAPDMPDGDDVLDGEVIDDDDTQPPDGAA